MLGINNDEHVEFDPGAVNNVFVFFINIVKKIEIVHLIGRRIIGAILYEKVGSSSSSCVGVRGFSSCSSSSGSN